MTTNGDRSDATTSLQQLKDEVQEFCEARDWDQFHNAKDLSIGVITEASELLEYFRFKSPQEIDTMLSDATTRASVAQEVVDVLYFLLRLAQRYDIDLSAEFDKKMRLNEARYPVNSARGSNRKYTDL